MTRVNWLFLKLLIALTLVLIYFASWSLPAKARPLIVLSQVSIIESLAGVNTTPSNVRIDTPIQNISATMMSLANRGMEQYKIPAFIIKWLFPPRVKNDDAPDKSQTSKAGARGQCSNLNKPLIALVPSKDPKVSSLGGLESALGFTVEEFPTFWFYIPSLPSNVNHAKFMLQEFLLQKGKYKDILDEPFAFEVKEGISNFSLQSVRVPLELGKVYHWYISIICDSERPSRNPSIGAWVKRVKPSSELSQIETYIETKERLKFYIEDGIWYETLTLLAKLRCQYQDAELFEAWSSLLQSIGIEKEIAHEPISSCP